ncbi:MULTISPECIES: hypothetical protein [unclassified Rhodococcus (in: high G+C Gram-positive bacteria)]|uniref:hypothetical protein n=1 Tax=unclassified Rhodococcus (in: high G+C Gram-positive bacteria) TaxID=192944 RepID=UPI0005E38A18|nr:MULTISPECIES: hypothetical protein [unclassified Rhodococcus (in: high G+C Gram-positive bacteria)]KJF21944.1 hypothetical protein SZ00_02588 [Rhodococcus sp. AD45]
MKPTVGRIVHYQSYGTPGGEYLPEPRAAIITQVCTVDRAQTSDEEPRIEYAVGLCVLNPTGQFFNTSVPYAEEPTPGHWNWPPTAGVESVIAPRDCSRCDGCGQVANTDDAEPWTYWAALPAGMDLAVQAGLVRPVTCLDCNGAGQATS